MSKGFKSSVSRVVNAARGAPSATGSTVGDKLLEVARRRAVGRKQEGRWRPPTRKRPL